MEGEGRGETERDEDGRGGKGSRGKEGEMKRDKDRCGSSYFKCRIISKLSKLGLKFINCIMCYRLSIVVFSYRSMY